MSLSLGSSPPWVATAGDILDSSSSGREIGGGGGETEEGDSAVRSATGRSSSWAGPPTASSSPSPRQPRVSGEDGCHNHGSSLSLWICNNSKPQQLSRRQSYEVHGRKDHRTQSQRWFATSHYNKSYCECDVANVFDWDL